MILRIDYFVHGTTLNNEQHLSTGWSDIPLSKLGLEQTLKAADDLPERKYDAIYSSDLLRAKQTAEILFSSQKEKIYYDERLRECNYGSLSEKSSEFVNYSDRINKPFPEGECLIDVQNRVSCFIKEILSKGNVSYIAIIAHRAPQLAFEVVINKKSWIDAIAQDWRKIGKWQLGWRYSTDSSTFTL